jgi:asparagine synthase (glutamine-hydrolysing)
MLSGVGAEELFAGYPRHRVVRMATRVATLPAGLRHAVLSRLWPLVPGGRPGPLMERMRGARKLLRSLAEDDFYIAACAHHDRGSLSTLLANPVDWSEVTAVHRMHLDRAPAQASALGRALYLDLMTFLPCLNLAYADRASMAASVEVRVPLLDEFLVSLATRLPDEAKLSGRTTKVVLRQAARGLIPDEIINRPKTGFGAPVRSWMRDASNEVVEDCLSDRAIGGRGWVEISEVRRMRERLRSGAGDEALALWALVVLELWARRFIDRPVL